MKVRVLFVLLAALSLLFTVTACSDDDEVDIDQDAIWIMSYNVEDFWVNVDRDSSSISGTAYDGVAALIRDNNIGVVCLQETQEGSSTTDTYGDGSISSRGDVTEFNKALSAAGYPMRYYAFSSDGGFRRDFMSVWSKYPIYDIASIRPNTMVDPSTGIVYGGYRPILRFRIRNRGKDIWFYNMHLKSNAGGIVEQNAARRRAQSYHLMRYITRYHNPETDLIVLLGDMNTMPMDYDGSGNSTIDYLTFRYDNPWNTANDFVPVNLKHIGAVTNTVNDTYDAGTPGTTHPGEVGGYPDATFDHIILSPTLYNKYYVQGSIEIIYKWDQGGGANQGYADHCPLMLQLQFTNN